MRSTKFPIIKGSWTPGSDHRFIDIAKIEGSEGYKSYMSGLQKEYLSVMKPRFCPFPMELCQYWPIRTSQPVNPLAPMLKSLILAAESTLQTKINSVAVTAYGTKMFDFNSTKQHVTSALGKLGVKSHEFLDDSVPSVIRALAIPDHKCSQSQYTPSSEPNFRKHPEQLVLSVDYTRDSLSSALWKVECKVIEQQERKYSSDGHDVVEYANKFANDTLRMENKIKSHLHYVTGNTRRRHHENPSAILSEQKGMGAFIDYQTVGGKAVQENIDVVLLMGEKAGDERMQTLLRAVLTEQFANGDSVEILQAQDISPDPAFVAARGAAWHERDIQRDLRWKRMMEVCDRNALRGKGCSVW